MLQVAVQVWQIWHVLMHAWHEAEAMPEEIAQILGIAMVDGLGAVRLLNGPQAAATLEIAGACLKMLLSGKAPSRFLRLLNPPPSKVSLR